MTLPRGFRRSSRAPPAIPSDPPAQRDVHTDDDHQDSHSDNITAPNGPDEILSPPETLDSEDFDLDECVKTILHLPFASVDPVRDREVVFEDHSVVTIEQLVESGGLIHIRTPQVVERIRQLYCKYESETKRINDVCDQFAEQFRADGKELGLSHEQIESHCGWLRNAFDVTIVQLKHIINDRLAELCTKRIVSPAKNRLPGGALRILDEWFLCHMDNPYPTDAEKAVLVEQSKLTLEQVNYWFGNRRNRYKRKNHAVGEMWRTLSRAAAPEPKPREKEKNPTAKKAATNAKKRKGPTKGRNSTAGSDKENEDSDEWMPNMDTDEFPAPKAKRAKPTF